MRHPSQFGGVGVLTVLTIDLTRGLAPIDSDGLMASGETVYASQTGLYVATQRWIAPAATADPSGAPPRIRTAIHKFDISAPDRTEYRASGDIPGYLLSQWAMSEKDGLLRVASTDAPPWWDIDESESVVTVLQEASGQLTPVGQLGGLGEGERIYAVRFIGDLGYVVTFRQVDPLHVIDLTDPTQPTLRGELEIQGYSAYLHPIGDGLLLGVGQDATAEGRVQGTQVSVFDVSDPANPQRLQTLAFPRGWSEAEFDHHAFLYWPATGLTVLPLQVFSDSGYFAGAVGLHVSGAGIAQLGVLEHPPPPENDYIASAAIRRSIVIGETLYTVSDTGVETHDLATLANRSWLPFS
jgi:hypothetical protein